MGFATGGYPSKDPAVLERRVSTLERILGSVRLIRIVTEGLAVRVLAREDGPGEAGTGGIAGAFFTQYVEDGDTFLQGGNIGAGVGSATMDDYDVTAGTASHKLWVEVAVNAINDNADEITISGLEITGAVWDKGATPPENEFPTLAAPGKLVIEIGRWNDTVFLPARAGNFNVSGATGTFRVNQ